ncbi:hypothetical protein [Streptosporangium sandarakinum]|uniref:hypothetical protein n=1 Tax=Streptosporangium sandarakinum TaxID=1260955 RepID=UPI0037960518
MLVVLALALAAIAILAGVWAVATGRGDELGEFTPDVPPLGLPEAGQLGAVDLMALHLPVSLVGYHTESVDEALNRVAAALSERDTRIAVLEQRVSELLAGRLKARQEAYAAPLSGPRTEHEPEAPWGPTELLETHPGEPAAPGGSPGAPAVPYGDRATGGDALPALPAEDDPEAEGGSKAEDDPKETAVDGTDGEGGETGETGTAPEPGGRPAHGDRSDRDDRDGQAGGDDRDGRTGEHDRAGGADGAVEDDRPGQDDRNDRGDRGDRNDRGDRSDRGDREVREAR